MSKTAETLAQHQHYKQECNVPNRMIFCHDNLGVLQGINSECIDLIYLDPPFNKKKTFTAPIGTHAEGASFKDIFYQEDVKDEWLKTIEEDYYTIHELLSAVKRIEGKKSYNFCYLAYMAIRLIEMHRVLKDTGSIYLHCDPTMSHYLKLVLDCIFGEKNFRNEIIWGYRTQGVSMKWWPRKHDIVFMYVKTQSYVYKPLMERQFYEKPFRHTQIDKNGKYFVDTYVRDVWDHDATKPTISQSPERTGYPTQKPLALLERIIETSSNKGGIVLDPFCGCATTCVAAEKLERRWIGIDISIKAYELVQERIKELYEIQQGVLADRTLPETNFSTAPPKRTDSGAYSVDAKYVYVISHPNYENEYKVGIASDPKSRVSGYQTGDPERSYKIEYQIRVTNYRELEQYVHKTFPNKHEWVHGDLQEIIAEIEKNAVIQGDDGEVL